VALSLTEAALPHAVAASWQHVRMADFRAALAMRRSKSNHIYVKISH
jgi:hypothetical protein